jgi:ABC-type bacteriocin/lantibiotic exporter with double-glycine peptidase domain
MDDLKAARQITMEQTVVSSAANLAISAMPDLAHAIVRVAGAVLVTQGARQLGLMLAFLSYIGYLFGPTYSFASFQAGMAALQRVSAIYNVAPEEERSGYPGRAFKRGYRVYKCLLSQFGLTVRHPHPPTLTPGPSPKNGREAGGEGAS